MPHRRRPGPVASRWVLVAGLLLAVLIIGVLATEMREERTRRVDDELDRQRVFARVLEDHVSRSLDSTQLVLGGMAGSVAMADAAQLATLGFSVELATLPQLRALAVLDAQGRVLAGSAPGDVGLQLDPARLGPWPVPGRVSLGAYLGARSLRDLAQGGAGSVPAGVGTVPVLQQARSRDGRPLLLLALLHPDGWANYMRLVFGQDSMRGLLVHIDGQLLASTEAHGFEPGTPLADAPRWRAEFAAREHAAFVGVGPGGPDRILAYRVARRWPVAVLVEQSREEVLAERQLDETTLAAGGALVALFVLLVSVVAARSLRSREAARAQVERSERELSLIVSSVQELLFRTDTQGRLTFVNARWRGPADPVGRALSACVMPVDAEAVERLFADDGGSTPRSATARLRDAAGTPGGRRHEINVTPLRVNGELVGFAGSAVDVHERWSAQQGLQAQLDFTELLLEIVPIPIALLDAHGSYLTVNRAWEQFAGWRRGEVLGREAARFQDPEDARRHGDVDRELLALGGSRRYEAGFQRRDGSHADLLVSKVAVPGEDGRPGRILSAFMDVSELRLAQRAVAEARDAAEDASRAKSEFIANISHELRTPLQSIIGFSELGMLRGRREEKLAAMFTDIHASGRRMLALVNDLLDVSKLESTVGTFHLERTDLRALLREVIHELDPLLAPRQLRIDAQLGEQPLVAKVDPLRFQQAVRNVLANAIKFCTPGHAIDVLAEATPSGEAHIAVRDRGPGIPPGELESIFEAFVQSSKTKDGSGGTGLGLAICRKIVAAHGGRIAAANAEGGGSVFHIHLPLRGFAETQPVEMA